MNADEHEFDFGCCATHCFWHNRDEPDGYRRCWECFHSYATKRELRYEHRWSVYIGPFTFLAALLTPASRIRSCPMCAHDF